MEVDAVQPNDLQAAEEAGCQQLHGVKLEHAGGKNWAGADLVIAVCASHGRASGFPKHFMVSCKREEGGDWQCREFGEFIAASIGGVPVRIFFHGDVGDFAFGATKFALDNNYIKPERRLDITREGSHWFNSVDAKDVGGSTIEFFNDGDRVYVEYRSSANGVSFKRIDPPAKPAAAESPDEDRAEYIAGLLNYLKQGGPDHWHKVARGWSFNSEVEGLTWIIRQPTCDRGTAMLIYWRGQPGWFKQYGGRGEVPEMMRVEIFDLLREIESRFASGAYARREIAFDPRNYEGADLTAPYQDVPEKHPIPKELLKATAGRTISETCFYYSEGPRCYPDAP